MLSLRDEIESTWLDNEQYRRIRQDQYDYAQVTSYGKPSPGIAKHCDYQGKAPSAPPMFDLSYPPRCRLRGRGFDPIYEKRQEAKRSGNVEIGARRRTAFR